MTLVMTSLPLARVFQCYVCLHSRSFPFRHDWWKSDSSVDGEPQENWRWNSTRGLVNCKCSLLFPSSETQGQSVGSGERRDESFQVRAKEPLGTDSHRAISKTSSGCRLLIGHKKCFVIMCLIGEHFLLSFFREFVHDCYCLATLARFVHQACASKENFYFLLS